MSGNRYRPVDTKIRGDAKFRALSAPPPSARELWLHLLICGHDRSIPGLLTVGVGGLADDLGWSPDDVRRCFAEIEAQGMAIADWDARVVWLPKAIAPGRNEPRAPNNVASMGGAKWAEVPECDLKWRAFVSLADHCAGRGDAFLDAAIAAMPVPDSVRSHAESLRKSARTKSGTKSGTKSTLSTPTKPVRVPPPPIPIPNTNTSVASPAEQATASSLRPPASRDTPTWPANVCHPERWVELWNEAATKAPKLRAVVQLSGLQIAGLRDIARDEAWWRKTLAQIPRSAWLRGEKRKWVPDPRWLLERGADNATKVHDGYYSDEREAEARSAITPSTGRDPKTRERAVTLPPSGPRTPPPPEVLSLFRADRAPRAPPVAVTHDPES